MPLLLVSWNASGALLHVASSRPACMYATAVARHLLRSACIVVAATLLGPERWQPPIMVATSTSRACIKLMLLVVKVNTLSQHSFKMHIWHRRCIMLHDACHVEHMAGVAG